MALTYYFFVEGCNFEKTSYNWTRTFAFNDWNNEYTPKDVSSVEEIFAKYGIPKEFQKLIINVCSTRCAEEYITGLEFDYRNRSVGKNASSRTKEIRMSNVPFSYDGWSFEEKYRLSAPLIKKSKDDVMKFFSKLKENDLFDAYCGAVFEIADAKLSIGDCYHALMQDGPSKVLRDRVRASTHNVA